MGCNCGGGGKIDGARKWSAEEGRVLVRQKEEVQPTEQCIACAQKHYDEAFIAFSECGYADTNRRFVRGSLRAVVLHTYREWAEIGRLARECALLVQEAKDAEAVPKMETLGRMIDEAFYEANPSVKQRLMDMSGKPDVIIPLGNGSHADNAELRMLLRSIERNLEGYGNIYLVTHFCPEWIDRDLMTVVDIDDIYASNKDANLHRKVLETIRRYGVHDFVFCADDNTFMSRMMANEIPVLHNHRDNSVFRDGNSVWQKRVWHTLEWARTIHIDLPHNYECHAPQLFDGKALAEGMRLVDYESQPGLTIYTAWRAVTDSWEGSYDQRDYKLTCELGMDESVRSMSDAELCAKPFLGYSDGGIQAGILERLGQIFPEKSKFEKF